MKYLIITCLLLTAIFIFYNYAFSKSSPLKTIKLNQGWQFRQAGDTAWHPATVPGTVHTDLYHNGMIEDPFFRTNEKNLQWIDKVDWEYQTIITADKDLLKNENIELVCEGLDTYAEVYLNDSLILTTDNMFREWRAECKSCLKEGGNKLRIYFRSPVKEDLPKLEKLGYQLPAVNDQSENGGLGDKKISPFARKAGYHYGWDWGPRFVTSGIWRPVYLQSWDRAKITAMQIVQKQVLAEKALFEGVFEIQATNKQKALLSIFNDDTSVQLANIEIELLAGLNRVTVDFEIKNPRLWWTNGLGKAHLYKISGRLATGDDSIDQLTTHIGIRTLKLVQEKDTAGKTFYFELNGIPLFIKGANYIPNDNFLPSVSTGEYEEVIQAAVDVKMNMLRVWGGGIYENDIFYNLCDKNGILVWQDFMFACAMYPGDDAFIENVKQEAIQNVKRLRNHPCIALWCGNNEIDAAWGYGTDGGWGWKEEFSKAIQDKMWNDYRTLFHRILLEIIKQYDDKTAYWPSSPMAGPDERAFYEATSGDIHYWGVWHGSEPFETFKLKIGRFMSEYGFQSFPEFNTVKTYTIPEDWDIRSEVMDAHQRSGIGNELIKKYMKWYYKNPRDFESFLYMSQVLQAEGVKMAIEAHRRKKPFCMGSLYWQLNDCWPAASWSSIDYYRRWKALHYFVKKAYHDILVSPTEDDGILSVWIISDKTDAVDLKLNINLMDLAGNILFRREMPVSIPGNSSQCFFKTDSGELLKGMDRDKIFLWVKVYQGANMVSSNSYYFVPVKKIKFPKPGISTTVEKVEQGYVIKLKTDHLAKNTWLYMEDSEGFFSDNYFDLIPGEIYTVYYFTQEKLIDFENKLKIRSVADSY
jgi:beta-mannosidase